MIQKAIPTQVAEIKELWNICFLSEDKRYTDYYFQNLFDCDNCLVYVLNGKVISSLIRAPHSFVLHGKVLRSSMILGVCTHPDYRHQGYMKKLLQTVLDACEHTELITLIQAYQPALYEPFGFRMIYRRLAFELNAGDLPRTNQFGLSYDPKPLDLLKVYSVYIKHFNGFYARDLSYFVKYRKEIIAQGGKIVAYYDGQDQIQGYASLLPQSNKQVVVEEIVYLDTHCLIKLINAAALEKENIIVEVSGAEDLCHIFPKAKKKNYDSTMARLNDADLFSKLYGRNVKTVEEAFGLYKKPLNLNEFA